MTEMWADSVARIPSDTVRNKTGIARIGSTLYAGNGTKWTAVGSGSFTGVDSLVITTTGCVKSFSTWKQGTQTVVGTVTQSNGVSPGTGIVTKTTGTTFTVSAATYTINCVTYQSRDTTITLTTAGHTGRIDVIKVNTSGVTTQGTGTEGDALALPSLSATELALTYVLVTDTGVTVSLPTDTALWVSVGTSIRNANTGPVNVRTNLQIGTYTPGSWLTSGAHTNTYFVAQDGFFTTNPASSSLTKNGIAQGFGNAINMWAGSNTIGTWNLVGNGTGSQFRIFGGMNPASGTGEGNGVLIDPALSPSGANSKSYNMLKIAPTYTQGVFGTGTLRGIYYNPILTSLNTSPHYFIEATSGLVKLAGITAEVDTTTWKPMAMNSSGDVRKLSYWPVGAGGGGSVGTLQQVTDLGATTTNNIGITGTFNNTIIDGAETWRLINDPGDDLYMSYENSVSGETRTTRAGEINTITSTNQVNRILLNTEGPFFGITSTNRLLNFTSNSINLRQGNHLYYVPANASSGIDTFAIVAQLTDSLNIIRDSLQVLRDSLAAYRAEDTVFTESGIETVYSGDSTTIRLPYKSYVALLSQSGTDAPTAIVLQNDLGGTVVWSRSSTGNYIATLVGAFTENKSWCVINETNDAADVGYLSLRKVDTDSFTLSTLDSSVTPVDDLLINTSIEIRVYY